jgi:hypothetical protein
LCCRPMTARGGTSPPFLQHMATGQLSKWVLWLASFWAF